MIPLPEASERPQQEAQIAEMEMETPQAHVEETPVPAAEVALIEESAVVEDVPAEQTPI